MQYENFILSHFLLMIQKRIIKANSCFALFLQKLRFIYKETIIEIIILVRNDFLFLKLKIVLEFILL